MSLAQLALEAEREYDGSCVLYFAQAADDGPIKIGITSAARLQRRIQELQNGCPWRVTLRRAVPGSRALEAAFHKTLSHWRLNSEWFYPLDELAALANGLPAHDSVRATVRP